MKIHQVFLFFILQNKNIGIFKGFFFISVEV